MTTVPKAKGPLRRRLHWRHPFLWLLLFSTLTAIVLGIGMGLTGRVIAAPGWVVARVEARANAALGGVLSARIGGVELIVDRDFVPHVRLRSVELLSPRGTRIGILPDLRATLYAEPLLRGRFAPRTLSIYGAQVSLRQRADGSLNVGGAGGDMAGAAGAIQPPELVQRVEDAFALPVLAGVETISVQALDLRFADDRSGRSWAAAGGWLDFAQHPDSLALKLGFTIEAEGKTQARTRIVITSDKTSDAAQATVEVDEASARDLASQSPALSWLSLLDAPISGTLSSGISAAGDYLPLDATLDIGRGALRPTVDTPPVAFDHLKLKISYDHRTASVTLPQIAIDGPSLRVHGSGTAWLKEMETGFPKSLVGQVAISDLEADPEGVFAKAVKISSGAADFRLRLDPFRIDIGQVVLVDGDRHIRSRGRILADPGGWTVAMDVGVDAITSDRLLALWPVAVVPKTRAWLVENVATSELFNVRAGFRLTPGTEPRFLLGYEFSDTEVRILKSLPPVQQGAGHATIDDFSYTLVVDHGVLTAPAGGELDVAGTVMKIPDFRIKPAPVRFTLRTESTITAALSVLDQPPFGFLTKAGKPVDIATGRARVEATLAFALQRKVDPRKVTFNVKADLTDVRSETIVPGRLFTAGRLDLAANRDALVISGPATLSGVPIDISWRQGLAPEERGTSRVTGSIELSQRALDAFAIALPKGTVGGRGTGEMTLEIAKGKPVEFALSSDLAGVALNIPQITLSKPPGRTGSFDIRGRFTSPPAIDRFRLEAAGLEAEGDIRLTRAGLDSVRLSKVRVGSWFDGAVTFRGRGKNRALGVEVLSGMLDMGRATFGPSVDTGAPLTIALDRLRISDGLSLTGLRGQFVSRGGLDGTFTGRLNGAVPVRGGTAPAQGGRTAVRILADDAGAALRAAGVFSKGRGGTLDLNLTPRAEPGQFDGALTIKNIRATGNPALAELLNAISVVGLLNQLNGSGILFTEAAGRFRLTPGAVEIREGSAVGPSMGISASGLYRIGPKTIDLQGTISPVYMLNGIGQLISRNREGLFGFNYRLAGAADAPDVSVNPLSILTPGMFRDIFRAAPPELSE